MNPQKHATNAAQAIQNTDLEAIFDEVWRHLHAGANAGKERSPYTMMQLATVGRDELPKIRTVVLRGADKGRSTLSFHTDVRSEKVREMERSSQVALLSSDVQGGIQIRMEGCARLVEDADERLKMWKASRPGTLILYQAPLVPGSVINESKDAMPRSQTGSVSHLAGFENFSVVEVTLNTIDYLNVSGDLHRRARLNVTSAGWCGQWVAP